MTASSPVSFPDGFATARLHAERLEPRHLADLVAILRDPVQMAMLGGVRDETQAREYLDRNLAHWDRYGFGVWIIRDAANGRVAGRAILRHLLLDDVDEVEVGYGFYQDFWGRGLATEIASACLAYGRDVLRLPSIVALTTPQNLRSRRVLSRVRLVYERDVLHADVPHVLCRTRVAWVA